MRIALMLAALLLVGCGSAKKDEQLLKEYREFRFSLYPLLDEESVDEILEDGMSTKVLPIIDSFYEANEERLAAYTLRELKKNEGTIPEIFPGYALKEHSPKSMMLAVAQGTILMKVATLNPFDRAYGTLTMAEVHIWGVRDYGKRIMADRLGLAKFITAQKDGKWQILVDRYHTKAVLEYDTRTGIALLQGYYVRDKKYIY